MTLSYVCRGWVKKAKVLPGVASGKGQEKRLQGHQRQREIREGVRPLLNGDRPCDKDVDNAKVLNAAFALVLLLKLAFRNPRSLRCLGKSGTRKTYPWWRRIRLGTCKQMGHKFREPDRMHP